MSVDKIGLWAVPQDLLGDYIGFFARYLDVYLANLHLTMLHLGLNPFCRSIDPCLEVADGHFSWLITVVSRSPLPFESVSSFFLGQLRTCFLTTYSHEVALFKHVNLPMTRLFLLANFDC